MEREPEPLSVAAELTALHEEIDSLRVWVFLTVVIALIAVVIAWVR